MNPSIFIRLAYAIWIIAVIYLTIAAFRAKQETEIHLGQSFWPDVCYHSSILASKINHI